MPKLRKTDHIEVCTGLRRSQDKKMEASKERCGLGHPGILVTGEIIVKKDLEYSSIRMETSMKVCGLWIRSMGKVHTGEMILIS